MKKRFFQKTNDLDQVPRWQGSGAVAFCPDCEVRTNFAQRYGYNSPCRCSPSDIQIAVTLKEKNINQHQIRLLACSACEHPAVAVVHPPGDDPVAFSFEPVVVELLPVPEGVHQNVLDDYNEAERCMNAGSWRAAAAMLRATVEKVLKRHGLTNEYFAKQNTKGRGDLKLRIETAQALGLITSARAKRAHDIRLAGNDVLHEEFRTLKPAEVRKWHRYAHRILEDFYDSPTEIAEVMKEHGLDVSEEPVDILAEEDASGDMAPESPE